MIFKPPAKNPIWMTIDKFVLILGNCGDAAGSNVAVIALEFVIGFGKFVVKVGCLMRETRIEIAIVFGEAVDVVKDETRGGERRAVFFY